MKYRVFLALLVAVVFYLPLLAQNQTGNLNGFVTHEGNPVAGLTVTINSPKLIIRKLTDVTNARGYFNFTYLPPGTYELTIEAKGEYQKQVYKGIVVNVGTTTNLGSISVRKEMAEFEDTVIISSPSPKISLDNNNQSMIISAELMKQLPVERTITDVMSLQAGLNKAANIAGVINLGGAARGNSYNLDGVYLNDPGRGTNTLEHSLDIYEEVLVQTGGHPAEYGQSTGAILNVVTKSGGNELSGSFSLYYQGDNLADSNFEALGLEEAPSTLESRYETNFTLGGNILTDKIWFFTAFTYVPSTTQIAGYNDTITEKSYLPLFKITAQPAEKHRLSFSLTPNFFRNPFSGAGVGFPIEVTSDAATDTYTGLLTWLYNVSDNTLLEFRGAFLNRDSERLANTFETAVFDLLENTLSGGGWNFFEEGSRWIGNVNLTQFVDDFNGEHAFKLGFEIERSKQENTQDWPTDAVGVSQYVVAGGFPLFGVVQNPSTGNPKIGNYLQYSGYVQDSWRLSDRLHLNLGVRMSKINLRIPTQLNVDQEIEIGDWTDFEPRIGIGIDPFGDGLTAVKFSYGRYTAPMYVFYDSFNPNNPATELYSVTPDFQLIQPPLLVVAGGALNSSDNIDTDMERQRVDEFIVSASRNFKDNWTAEVSYVHRRYRNFFNSIVANWGPDAYVPIEIQNPIGGTLTVYDQAAGLPPALAGFTNSEYAFRNYDGVTLSFNKSFSNGAILNGSYTWSETYGRVEQGTGNPLQGQATTFTWDDPNQLINTEGLLDEDRTHSIKIQGVMPLPYDFLVSVNYNGMSGTPYQRIFLYNGFVNRTPGTFFAEERGSQRYDFLHLFSLRGEKSFTLEERYRLSIFTDIFNPFNWDATTSQINIIGPAEGTINGIQDPRRLQIGARFEF